MQKLEAIKDYLCNTDGAISLAVNGKYTQIAKDVRSDYDIKTTITDGTVKTAIAILLQEDLLFNDFYKKLGGK